MFEVRKLLQHHVGFQIWSNRRSKTRFEIILFENLHLLKSSAFDVFFCERDVKTNVGTPCPAKILEPFPRILVSPKFCIKVSKLSGSCFFFWWEKGAPQKGHVIFKLSLSTLTMVSHWGSVQRRLLYTLFYFKHFMFDVVVLPKSLHCILLSEIMYVKCMHEKYVFYKFQGRREMFYPEFRSLSCRIFKYLLSTSTMFSHLSTIQKQL